MKYVSLGFALGGCLIAFLGSVYVGVVNDPSLMLRALAPLYIWIVFWFLFYIAYE